MKVLMIIPANLGADNQIAYSTLIKNEIEGLRETGVDVVEFYNISRKSIVKIYQNAREIKNIVKEQKIDIVHAQTGPAALPMLLSNISKPLVLTIGGSDLLGYRNKGKFWKLKSSMSRLTTKFAAIKSDRIICVSSNLKNNLNQRLQNKTVIFPRGVNTNFFRDILKDEARNILSWNLNEKYVVFAQTHNNSAVKNLPLARSVVENYNSVHGKSLELEIINKKKPGEVLLMLNAADALLVTSFHEGSPNIVKEAMACNLPIVSVDCGDVKERLMNVDPSIVTKTYKVSELTAALYAILKQNTRSNGKEIIKSEHLDRNATSNKLKSLYNHLIH